MENNINQKPTKIFALGGIEEIGKNMYVVQQDDEIFIVDCGIKFADENELFGVNSIICPFDYLVENKNKIKALIVTHGHEDHIGGIPYLLKTVSIPKIYAAKLPLGLVKKKLKEHDNLLQHTFEEINDNSIIKTKNFTIEFFRVCHSIPDAFGVYFKTINGKIVTAGDFRFDFSTKGDESDIQKMARIGSENIDVLLCESTNAETEGFSVSEKYIIEVIEKIINKAKGRILVSTFASNLGRIEEIIEIAIKNNRKITIMGRSIDTNISISIKSGFLNVSKDVFFPIREIDNYPDNEVLILSTGSQGEEMAGLSQIANGKHPWVTLKKTDTLIMSSNPIPGNFESVEKLINKLYHKRIKIYTNSGEQKLHSSGHATETEQQLLFKLINPMYLVPIHGEYKMLKKLRDNAVNSGMARDNVVIIRNGQILELLNGKLTLSKDAIDIYDVYVDGNSINSFSSGLLKCRKILSQDGLFNVTIVIDRKNKKIVENPILINRGCLYAKNYSGLIIKMTHMIKDEIQQEMNNSNRIITNNDIRLISERIIQTLVWRNKKKKPIVRVTVFDKD